MSVLCLYAVQYADGVVKLGISQSFTRRLYALRRRCAIVSYYVGALPVVGFAAESDVLQRASRIGVLLAPSKELFVNLRFCEARQLVAQASARWSVEPRFLTYERLNAARQSLDFPGRVSERPSPAQAEPAQQGAAQ